MLYYLPEHHDRPKIFIYIEWKQLYRWTMYRCLPTTFITNHWWYKKWINRNVAATRIAVSEWVSVSSSNSDSQANFIKNIHLFTLYLFDFLLWCKCYFICIDLFHKYTMYCHFYIKGRALRSRKKAIAIKKWRHFTSIYVIYIYIYNIFK